MTPYIYNIYHVYLCKVFLKRFLSDLKKIKGLKTKRKIIALIETLLTAKNLDELSSFKKISGYGFAYRLRMGDYRLGFFTKTIRSNGCVFQKE